MKKIFAILICLCASPAFADPPQTMFMTTTITDIGRPYSVIDGMCAFGSATGFDIMTPEMESAFQAGATRLDGMAKEHGADAIVGMQVSPVIEGETHGVLVCGTFVKFK